MMNHICLFLPSRSWSSFTDPEALAEGWKAELTWVAGYIQRLMYVPHRELYPDTVTHPSIHVPIRLNVG